MKTTYIPLGITALFALAACSGEKKAPPVAPPVPTVSPAAAGSSAAPGRVTPPPSRTAEPVQRALKKKTPKHAAPSTETIKKPEEIIRTQTIVS